jgi:hypothetical protein
VVTVAEGEQKQGVDLELDAAATISGSVIDQDGKPVSGARVEFLLDKTQDQGRDLTGEDGTFTCGAMTGGGDYTPSVYPSNDARDAKPFELLEGSAPVHVERGDSAVTGVRLRVKRELLTISGKVVDGSGAPVPDVRVAVKVVTEESSDYEYSWGTAGVLADAAGAYSVGDLVTGSYRLRARGLDGSEGFATAAAGATNVTITVPRAGGLDGQLVGFTDTPSVYAQGESFRMFGASIDGDTFHITGLPPGAYTVTARTPGEQDSEKITVTSGQTAHVVLTSRGRARVEGSLVDFHTREPLAGFECTVGAFRTFGPGGNDEQILTGPDGRFVIDPAPAGDLDVSCYSPSFSDYTPGSAHVTVERGATATLALIAVKNASERSDPGFVLDWTKPAATVASVTRPGDLAPGDVIAQVDGQPVAGVSPAGVMEIVGGRPPGSTVAIMTSMGKNVTITTTESAH